MKISKISYERMDFALANPYTIAYETVSKTSNFILKIETDSTLVGYGCAAPDLVVTGETPDQAEVAIKNIVIPYLKGKDPFTYVAILEALKELLKNCSSVLAMVDIALHDLISRKADVPLYQLLGGYRSSIATSITIGIIPLEETLKEAAEYIKQGFFILKIKGGLNVQEDIEKMLRLKEVYPSIKLRFDGNQGYDLEQGIEFVKATSKIGIEIFEQPILIGKEEKLGTLTQSVALPVMADESLKTLADAFRLAKNERIDMINIKLMKVGGILEGLHINSIAKAAKLEAMVGCIDECGLGIAAGLHFALARPNIHFADLDGHLDLINDPFKGLFEIKKGVMYPSKHPGLGPVNL